MHYLNGDGKLPSKNQMLEDIERDVSRRFSFGWPNKKAHSVMGKFQREYYNELATTANIPNVRELYLKIFDDCGERRQLNPIKYRDDVYTIIEGENFERRSLSSNEFYKSY